VLTFRTLVLKTLVSKAPIKSTKATKAAVDRLIAELDKVNLVLLYGVSFNEIERDELLETASTSIGIDNSFITRARARAA